MADRISQIALDQLFFEARTHNKWLDKSISDMVLKELANLLKWGPTSANCSPLRIVFIKDEASKKRLEPLLMDGNKEKTMSAPVCAILAHDMNFYEHLPTLFPHDDAKSWFEGNDELIAETAFRNGTLQAAYFIMAARALGLDTGAMSGFDNDAVDKEFFAGTSYKSNFLCNLGFGDPEGLFPRSPRFSFDAFVEII